MRFTVPENIPGLALFLLIAMPGVLFGQEEVSRNCDAFEARLKAWNDAKLNGKARLERDEANGTCRLKLTEPGEESIVIVAVNEPGQSDLYNRFCQTVLQQGLKNLPAGSQADNPSTLLLKREENSCSMGVVVPPYAENGGVTMEMLCGRFPGGVGCVVGPPRYAGQELIKEFIKKNEQVRPDKPQTVPDA